MYLTCEIVVENIGNMWYIKYDRIKYGVSHIIYSKKQILSGNILLKIIYGKLVKYAIKNFQCGKS